MSEIITAKLYSAAPVLICALGEPSSLVSVLTATGLDVLLYDPHTRIFHQGEGQLPLAGLRQAPSCFCSLFATMGETEAQMEELRTWWSGFGAGDAPETVRLLAPVGTSGVSVIRHVAARLADEISRGSAATAQLLRQTVELRAELEELRPGPVGALILGASCEPVNTEPPLRGPEASFTFPCRVFGLAKLELHFSAPGASGNLTVALRSPRDNAMLEGWCVDYQTLTGGWHEFPLLQPLTVRDHRITLTLAWETAEGEDPALDLSNHIALPYGGVFVDRAPSVVQLPALRLWYSR
jgi:hypothetical protein